MTFLGSIPICWIDSKSVDLHKDEVVSQLRQGSGLYLCLADRDDFDGLHAFRSHIGQLLIESDDGRMDDEELSRLNTSLYALLAILSESINIWG